MPQIGETMVLGLQASLERERTLLEFLRERMDGPARVERRRSLKQRLGLNGFGCCGAHWGFSVLDDDGPQQQEPLLIPTPPEISAANTCLRQSPAAETMNLATALAAEREYRSAQESPVSGPIEGTETPLRMSLMRLLHETEEYSEEELERESREKVGCDTVCCCVCMGRKKGAAFIPCGHTFCRVCSRELWLNRGSCPLCNRPILEILDIF